jgi:predicted HicB family RNase H-like nuclease
MNKVALMVRVDEKLRKKAKRLALQNDLSMAQYIAKLIREAK